MSTPAAVHLRLGRVSNLPTVWSNVICGTMLGDGPATSPFDVATIATSMSLFYVGGMYLNDAFDREIDAKERPERPIPAGLVSAREVFAIGSGLLGAAILVLVLLTMFGGARPSAIATGVALGGAIVLYDVWHKQNPLSPVLMGLCRVLVYGCAALAAGGAWTTATWSGAAVLLSYLIGLTYVAKQETLDRVQNFWPLLFLAAPMIYAPARGIGGALPLALSAVVAAWAARAVLLLRRRVRGNIPRAVASLIAGISLVDALLVASHGAGALPTLACAAGLPATLLLHRWVAGT